MPESPPFQHPAAPSSPEAAAGAFFDALESRRWADAARLVHPAALARYREHTLSSVRATTGVPERPAITPEDFLRHDPQMPREVAEYQARRSNEAAQEHRGWALERAGVASLEELERLSPEEAFARFLAASDEQQGMQRAMEGKVDEVVGELLTRMAPRTERTVIGSVPAPAGQGAGEAGGSAYVTYSITHRVAHAPTPGPEQVAVVRVRRDGPAWKLDPDEPMMHELFGGGSFAVSVGTEDGSPSSLFEMARTPAVWPAEGTPRLRVRMAGAGDDPLKVPPTGLILERLAPGGAVAASVEVPAEAWDHLSPVVSLWALLVTAPEQC